MSPQSADSLATPVDWFDGHLDLAYIAQHGRDLTRNTGDCGGSLQPASVTFPALRAAHLHAAVSTLFIRQKKNDIAGDYTFSTPDEAFAAAMRQVELHRGWEGAGEIMLSANNAQSKIENRGGEQLKITLAIEGAACLRTLDDADAFHACGVRMMSLAWAEGSAWAGGDQSGGDVTAAGKQLIARLDRLGVVHDVSHLSERAFNTLLDSPSPAAKIVASHSNCRALLPGAKFPERHLSDAQIQSLAARPSSKIGITLFARFILPPEMLATRRATIADLLRHIEHIEQLTGRRSILALGSDFDSGFGTDLLPIDLQGPHDLPRLADALAAAGWNDAEIRQFASGWSDLFPA